MRRQLIILTIFVFAGCGIEIGAPKDPVREFFDPFFFGLPINKAMEQANINPDLTPVIIYEDAEEVFQLTPGDLPKVVVNNENSERALVVDGSLGGVPALAMHTGETEESLTMFIVDGGDVPKVRAKLTELFGEPNANDEVIGMDLWMTVTYYVMSINTNESHSPEETRGLFIAGLAEHLPK